MRSVLLVFASTLALCACGMEGQDDDQQEQTASGPSAAASLGYETYSDDNLADTMASNDSNAKSGDTIADSEERPIMQAQVILDRQGFGPGVIDGKMGMSTENALQGFQEANGLDTTGELDEATRQALARWDSIPATRVVTIPDTWAEKNYSNIPEDTSAQAKMERLGYKSLDEKLAERFHTTVEVLQSLNPGGQPAGTAGAAASPSTSPSPSASATGNSQGRTASAAPNFFKAGQRIRVPNIGGDRIARGSIDNPDWQQTIVSLGVGTDQPEVDRIVVSKAGKTLKAYQGDKLVALFTVSSGSSDYPLPLGEWDIVGESYNPTYEYDPEVLRGGNGKTYMLPPGPNGPVGVVWIDLSKEHYGIHGTPDPGTIGRAQSHGCVRLTNWDAARLAGMVSQSTRVIFEA